VAELVGAFAASHAPLLARDWNALPATVRERVQADFRELGGRLAAARPDVLVVVAPDHWTNFFLDNLPSICIGVGAVHGGPPEPFLRDFPFPEPAGDPGFGEHLVANAFTAGFEPSVSHRARLDHGICLPLLRMELAALPRIVPLFLNSLEPPMPALRRCLAWGGLIARAVASYPARHASRFWQPAGSATRSASRRWARSTSRSTANAWRSSPPATPRRWSPSSTPGSLVPGTAPTRSATGWSPTRPPDPPDSS